MKKRFISEVMAILMAGTMILSGCSGETTSTSESAGSTASAQAEDSETAEGGVVTIARDLDSSNLDPVMTADNVDIWVLNMIVEGLVTSSDDGTEIIPAVADTWEISDDGLTYTFHIRDGIKFSNGEDVTIEDCIYSLQRAKDTDGPWIGMLDMIESMEDGGDGNLIITLNTASPSFLSTLAMFSSGIMPKSYCEEVGEEGISQKPIGTGPFVLTEWDKGEKMIFSKNDNYWEEGCPKVDEIDMVVVEDDNTRIMQLESGQIDIATQVPFSRIDELKAMDNLSVSLFDSTDVKFVVINCQDEHLSDKRVRQALKLATDKESINSAVYFGYGENAETFVATSAPHFDSSLETTKLDIDAAKALMDEAGYADGFDLTLEVGSGDSTYLQIATMLQEEWSQIGVNLDIQQIDTATARQNWKDGNYDVYISYMTSDMTDTSELAGLWTITDQANCWRSYWDDEDQDKAEELCKKANSEMDESARLADYSEMQEIVADAVPLIPIVYTPYTFVSTDKISGAAQTPLGIYNFKNMTKSE